MSGRSEKAEVPAWRKLVPPLLELGPLLAFFVTNGNCQRLLDYCAGETQRLFAGTAVFMVTTVIVLPIYRVLERRWPIMPLVGGFFILVFGGLTLWLQDETFIKMKPTIVNCLFATILAAGLLFGRPLLKIMFAAAFRLTDLGWTILTRRWAVFFLVLAAVNEVMWRFFSTETWIASKMALSMPLTIVFALAQTPLLKRHWDGDDNPFAPERKD
ncbi:MAG: septation protein A [Alphaproteobacteria bacterium]|nr:septation protein A [Alphaproteobacteria bacterium]MCW5740602.1 septation protein A [Alphaproteobacteria bacterium]